MIMGETPEVQVNYLLNGFSVKMALFENGFISSTIPADLSFMVGLTAREKMVIFHLHDNLLIT